MSIRTDQKKYLQRIQAFLDGINIPGASERVDDEVFMAEYVFPLANETFIGEYWSYRNADHYLRNKEFYDDPVNYEIHPIY